MKKVIIALISLFIFNADFSNAQLAVEANKTGTELAEVLAGKNIIVTNVIISGNTQQYGSFTYSGNDLQVNFGVILSSGDISDAAGLRSCSEIRLHFRTTLFCFFTIKKNVVISGYFNVFLKK